MSGFQRQPDPNLLNPNSSVPASVSPIQAITPPMGTTLLDVTVAFVCSIPSASFHRQDGKKIPFQYGYHETNILQDIQYLDAEIAAGNQYLRRATEDESQHAHMQRDPRGTIKEQLRKEMEPQLRAEIEEQIRAELAGIQVGSISDSEKLEGVSSPSISTKAQRILENAKGAKVLMTSAPAPLKGIVSTVDVAGTAAGSASTGGSEKG